MPARLRPYTSLAVTRRRVAPSSSIGGMAVVLDRSPMKEAGPAGGNEGQGGRVVRLAPYTCNVCLG